MIHWNYLKKLPNLIVEVTKPKRDAVIIKQNNYSDERFCSSLQIFHVIKAIFVIIYAPCILFTIGTNNE